MKFGTGSNTERTQNTEGQSTKLTIHTSKHVTGSGKTRHFWQTKKNEFFMLIKSYNLSQLSAKILEGKTSDSHRNWQLNWAVFSKAIELEIVKT